MCNSNNKIYTLGNSIYDKKSNDFLSELDNINFGIEDIQNNNIFSIFEQYTKFYKNDVNIPVLDNFLINNTLTQLLKYNFLNNIFTENTSVNKSVKDNLWNFSLAKTYNFLLNIKRIKDSKENVDERLDKLTKVVYNNHLTTEIKQTKRVTETSSTVIKNEYSNKKILTFVTYQDNKVRDSHEHLEGMTLPANHPNWKNAAKILGEWNCRCQIVEVFDKDNVELKNVSNIKTAKSSNASMIDIKEGRVEVFKDTLPIFEDTEIIRKYYRGNNF